MTVGYDPDRVRSLTHRTRLSIEALTPLRSTDPCAANAMRALRLLRQNLEDHWMPALLEIQRSEAMVSWTRAGLAIPWWMGGRPTGRADLPAFLRPAATPLSPLSDDDLLSFLARMDRLLLTEDPPDDLDPLAVEVAGRVAHDEAFADRLAQLAGSTPLVGFLTGRTRFPASFVASVVRSMMWPHGPVATVDLDQYADSLSTAIAAIAAVPAACLDLLLDPVVLHGVASWERLDADVVTEFVLAGLHTAVVDDPARLVDGYGVLAVLTTLVNGPLDHGCRPAMALGVAAAMVGYIDTLAPAIRQEGSYPVLIVAPGMEVALGDYDDVVDLFGSLLGDPAAQAALGTVLGAYTNTIVTDLGAEIGKRPGLEYVARFTDLIADASRTEQAELVMKAAAEEARRRQLGSMIGFGVTAALTASGAGWVTHVVVSRAVSMASNFVARVDPTGLPDARIPSFTYDLITVGALGVVAADPVERRHADLGAVPLSDWSDLRRRLAEIDDEDDPDERTRQILRLDHWIEDDVPLLAAYLGRVRSVPGMDELTESRNAVGTD